VTLKDRNKDLLASLEGVLVFTPSMFPPLDQMLGGWDEYRKSKFERALNEVFDMLNRKVDDLRTLFSDKWCTSEEGKNLAEKYWMQLVGRVTDLLLESGSECTPRSLPWGKRQNV
jgi:hypothetical protein